MIQYRICQRSINLIKDCQASYNLNRNTQRSGFNTFSKNHGLCIHPRLWKELWRQGHTSIWLIWLITMVCYKVLALTSTSYTYGGVVSNMSMWYLRCNNGYLLICLSLFLGKGCKTMTYIIFFFFTKIVGIVFLCLLFFFFLGKVITSDTFNFLCFSKFIPL